MRQLATLRIANIRIPYVRSLAWRRRSYVDNIFLRLAIRYQSLGQRPAPCLDDLGPCLLILTEDRVAKYLQPHFDRPTSKNDVYQRILESAQNTQMKPNVIGRAIGGVDKLAGILANFDPKEVLSRYADNWEKLLDDIEEQLRSRGQIRRTPRGIWPHYCQTVLSVAQFLEQFSTFDDFINWVDFFDRDTRARASLPMLLSHEIEGFGFALSCDFLKEIGYVNFAKPDVQLREIFTALELCEDGADDYHLFKAIVRVAENAKVTPYNADKTFWLIGSGYFYQDRDISVNGRIPSQKQEFIKFARSKLYGK